MIPRSLLVVVSFCCTLFAGTSVLAQDGEAAQSDAHVSYLSTPVGEISGPMRTVAVGSFDAIGGFTATYGNWDIGGGLAAMLTSALVDSGRFIVVERAMLSDILTEQELAAGGLTSGAASVGQMAGAQLLVYGSVTQFDTRAAGSGLSIGLSSGGWKGGVGRKKTEGEVAFDFRVVDTSTGEIIESHSVSRVITAKGFDMSVGYEGVSIGDDNFSKTPLGEACREAITEAVHLIARDAAETPWSGSVVDFDGRQIYINAGERTGVSPGDRFFVERIERVMTDPETGEVLLVEKYRLGTVALEQVFEKLSVGAYQPLSPTSPERGDLVVLPTAES